ncbi:threonylcarbamoyl-AMP synthase [Candidatus Woesearchaeota archaeon]|nr:MAG: threonylcarbamoyl-AMP synthase [Candidatus Woesearchaeota archaeon]
MMRTLSKDEVEYEKHKLMKLIREGSIFIYPTDTIYGIGCNGLDEECVKKIRKIKKRNTNPFSVIAPSKEWIYQNCEVGEKEKEWVEKLPGPYTLILKLKNKNLVPKQLNNGLNTLGVRIPQHWISDFVKELGIPIVTTSANIAGKRFMTSLEDLDSEIKKNVDFMIYTGKIDGRPSKLIKLHEEKVSIVER